MRSIEEYRKIAADLRDTNATSLEHQASSAIEELLEVIKGQTGSVRVETPLGTIIARPSDYGEHYPGLFVTLHRDDADRDLLLALVKVSHSRKNGQKKTRKSREEMKIKRQRD